MEVRRFALPRLGGRRPGRAVDRARPRTLVVVYNGVQTATITTCDACSVGASHFWVTSQRMAA